MTEFRIGALRSSFYLLEFTFFSNKLCMLTGFSLFMEQKNSSANTRNQRTSLLHLLDLFNPLTTNVSIIKTPVS